MKIILKNKSFEVENRIAEIEPILALIQKMLDEEALTLSHLVIDGVAVYQDYHAYLSENIENVVEVVVETQSLKPLIDETLGSTFDYLSNAVALLKPLSEAFYQAPTQEAWSGLTDLFGGIEWLSDVMERIDGIDHLNEMILNYHIWNEYVQIIKSLKLILPEMEQAMVNQDHVLIGDLILYEILPVFETAVEKLRFLVPSGGAHVS